MSGLVSNDSVTSENELNSNNHPQGKEIKDKYHIVLILFYILGTLSQIPSNFVVTANDYWMYKFRDINGTQPDTFSNNAANRTDLQNQFTSSYSLITNVASVASIFATIHFGKKINPKHLVMTTLSIVTTIFIITLSLVEVDTDNWQTGFYGLTLTMGFILTVASASFMITLFGLAARFPPRYLASVLSGQAVCGIASAVTQIIALSTGASSLGSANIYFSVGTVFIIASCISLWLTYKRSDYFKYKLKNSVVNPATAEPVTKEKILHVLGKIKWILLTMLIVAGSSVMIHPSVTSLVVSVNKGNGNKWNDVFFVPVCTFLLYNVLDLAGRELAAILLRPKKSIILAITAICRIVFLPLFFFCNAQKRVHTNVLFNNDYTYIILIIIFGFTNGYLINMAILDIPRVVVLSEKKISILLILGVMILGMGICSSMSVLIVRAL